MSRQNQRNVGARPKRDDYKPVDTVPADLRWQTHRLTTRMRSEYSFGKTYKRVTDFTTDPHTVTYFMKRDTDDTPLNGDRARAIDSEPEKKPQRRIRVGAVCWYIHEGTWYLAVMASSTRTTLTIRKADDAVEWPFAEEIKLGRSPRLREMIRPIEDKKP